jgi:hypothetical protein
MQTLAFFSPGVEKRALVVFTDGESQPVSTLGTDFAATPKVDVTFVRMGEASERIYEGGVAEAGYMPDPAARVTLAAAAAAVQGRVVQESAIAEAAPAVRAALGTGPTSPRLIEGNRQALMPWVALLAVVPLGFVLYRRNL